MTGTTIFSKPLGSTIMVPDGGGWYSPSLEEPFEFVENYSPGSGGSITPPFETLPIVVSELEVTLQEGGKHEITIENFDEFEFPIVLFPDNEDIVKVDKDKILIHAPYLKDVDGAQTFIITLRLGCVFEGIMFMYDGIELTINVIDTNAGVSVVDIIDGTEYVGSQVLTVKTINPTAFTELIEIEVI